MMKIYADNAATTKMSGTALEAMLPYMTEHFGNPSSLYTNGQEAKEGLEAARATVAACIGAAGGLDLSRAARIRPAQGFCLHNSTWTRRHTSPLCSPQAAAYYRRTAFSSAFSVSRMLFTSSSAS